MSEDERKRRIAPFRAARLLARGNLGVAQKLWLGYGLLILILVIAGFVSYRHVRTIDQDLRRFFEIEKPLDEAIHDMQTSLSETDRAVLDYSRERKPQQRQRKQASEGEFSRAAAEFGRLTDSEEQRRLVREAVGLFSKFKTLGDEIATVADRQNAALASFRDGASRLDTLLDDDLRSMIVMTDPNGMATLHIVYRMEHVLDAGMAAIEHYVSEPGDAIAEKAREEETTFQALLARYREHDPSSAEKGILDRIEDLFAGHISISREIVAATDALHARLDRYEQDLRTIDAVLDDRIRPLIQAKTAAVVADAASTTGRMAVLLFALVTVALFVTFASAWNLSRDITGPIRALVAGTDIVAGGGFAHRIDIKATGEIGRLAAAFNRMVGNLEKSESLLRGNEARLRAIVQTAADGIVTIDERGIVESFNRAAERLFGYAEDEVVGRNVSMLMPEPYRAEHDGFLTNYLDTGENKMIGIGREVVGRRKDGTTFPMDLAVSDAYLGDRGVFTGIVRDISGRKKADAALRVAHDTLEQRVQERTTELLEVNENLQSEITERKRAEHALSENQQRLNAIMNSVVDAVLTYDADGFIQSYNRAAERIFTYSRIQALQMNVSDLMREEYFDDHDDYLQKLCLGEDTSYTGERPEVTGRRQDGSTFLLELSVSRMDVPGQTMLVAICRDITERKQVEAEQAALEHQLRQSQKMESIGQLTGGIAHDFNNLLMIIDGYARRTLGNLDDLEVAGRSLEQVLAATEKAARLTKQLLVFSRRQVMEKRVFRVTDVLRDLKALLAHAVGEFYDFKFEAADRKLCVRTDPAELTQAIINLAVNARDAMPKGGTISIAARVVEVSAEHASIHASMAPGRYVRLSVSDQGTGIDAENLQHIFEPFFTTKEQGEGTGLGLAMVHGFAEQSGGAADVESVLDEGTTVSIFLPVVDQLPDEVAVGVEQEYCGKGERILLVEDDDRLLELTYDMLQDLGYTVFVAGNGLEALELDEELDGAIDLLVSDVVMPSLGGFELYEILREKRPDLRAVFMSGYPTRGTGKVEIPENTPLLQKPVGPNQFAQAIRTEIDKIDAKLCDERVCGSIGTSPLPLPDNHGIVRLGGRAGAGPT